MVDKVSAVLGVASAVLAAVEVVNQIYLTLLKVHM